MLRHIALLISIPLAPAFAASPECTSPKGGDLCAEAVSIAKDAMSRPDAFADQPAPPPVTGAFHLKWALADGNRVILQMGMSQPLKPVLADVSAGGMTLGDYQALLKDGMRMELCGAETIGAFIEAGGRLTTVFETADGHVAAAIATKKCIESEE